MVVVEATGLKVRAVGVEAEVIEWRADVVAPGITELVVETPDRLPADRFIANIEARGRESLPLHAVEHDHVGAHPER